MKEHFSAYLPKKTTIDDINSSIISFDANTILNLYRFKEKTTLEYLSSIKAVSDRIWLTYISALEYNILRTTIIKQEKEYLDNLNAKIKRFKDDVLTFTSNKHHNSFPFQQFNEKLKTTTSELSNLIISCQSNQKDMIRKDPIRDELFNLFDQKTGGALSDSDLDSIYNVAQKRFSAKIPPGYMDEKNKSGKEKLYGDTVIKSEYSDYILWHELIQKAKDSKCNIVLVTDEKKEDWILKVNGINLGARPELITEMNLKTGCSFSIISSLDFINLIAQTGNINISQASVDDINDITSPSWKTVVVTAFNSMGGVSSLNQLYEWIEKNKPRPLTKQWKVTARKTIYSYCPERDIYLGTEALFKQVDDGVYKLINDI